MPKESLRKELQLLLNRHSAEGGSNTPDFILGNYLWACLYAFESAVCARDDWYGKSAPPPAAADDGGRAATDIPPGWREYPAETAPPREAVEAPHTTTGGGSQCPAYVERYGNQYRCQDRNGHSGRHAWPSQTPDAPSPPVQAERAVTHVEAKTIVNRLSPSSAAWTSDIATLRRYIRQQQVEAVRTVLRALAKPAGREP